MQGVNERTLTLFLFLSHSSLFDSSHHSFGFAQEIPPLILFLSYFSLPILPALTTWLTPSLFSSPFPPPPVPSISSFISPFCEGRIKITNPRGHSPVVTTIEVEGFRLQCAPLLKKSRFNEPGDLNIQLFVITWYPCSMEKTGSQY